MSSVLLVGAGGREHALAWKLLNSSKVTRLISVPGNDGFPKEVERLDFDFSEGKSGFVKLAQYCVQEKVSLVVVGPDNPLADGIVDVFNEFDIPCFGPTRAAAQLEWSKGFAKEVMKEAKVPTAFYRQVNSSKEAHEFLNSVSFLKHGWVVKADGLALGKGVEVCDSREAALAAAERLINISGSLVIEERVFGEEVSWMAFCDGTQCALLEPAQDYKRLKDSNEGPNTGGMGAVSPVPFLMALSPAKRAALKERVRAEVFEPTLKLMNDRGTPFRGLLYAGLMVSLEQDRFWVIEYNSRFGDPETQVQLARLDSDLYDWLLACAQGNLKTLPHDVPAHVNWAVTVVAAAPGYPESPVKGLLIEGELRSELSREVPAYFIAGAKRGTAQKLVTAGGRVFSANGVGDTLAQARTLAYDRLSQISFQGMQFRKDVGAGVKS